MLKLQISRGMCVFYIHTSYFSNEHIFFFFQKKSADFILRKTEGEKWEGFDFSWSHASNSGRAHDCPWKDWAGICICGVESL